MRVLHLYRPRLPGLRAQAIQVTHMCHALAIRGHRVTLLADRGAAGIEPAQALARLGLEPHVGLDLRISPRQHSGLAGLWFRRALARWWRGPPGLVLARDKRRLDDALRAHGRSHHRLVLETHELDSALAADRGEASTPVAALEARLAAQADALVANCGGTLRAWEAAHPRLPTRRAALHNATRASRRRAAVPSPEPVIRYVGSFQTYKGLDTLLAAAPALPLPLELVGGDAEALGTLPANTRARPPLPYPQVPDLLARSAVLVLPLADNRFGRQLTSPLKLWDYLATAVPIVAPDLPTIREIGDTWEVPLHLYAPGDPASLARACREALGAPPRSPRLRTWDQRAAELEALLA